MCVEQEKGGPSGEDAPGHRVPDSLNIRCCAGVGPRYVRTIVTACRRRIWSISTWSATMSRWVLGGTKRVDIWASPTSPGLRTACWITLGCACFSCFVPPQTLSEVSEQTDRGLSASLCVRTGLLIVRRSGREEVFSLSAGMLSVHAGSQFWSLRLKQPLVA